MKKYIDIEQLDIQYKLQKVKYYGDEDEQLTDEEMLHLLLSAIDTCPAADVAEVKHGYWTITPYKSAYGNAYRLTCSECNATTSVTEAALPYEKFCRECGAKMDKKG